MSGDVRTILLVDDEEKLLNSMSQRLELLGFEPLKALSFMQAMETARNTHIDMAIVDLKMPDIDGLVTITKLKELYPDLKTVLLTGYGNEKVKQATEALGSLYFEKDSMAGLWDLIREYEDKGRDVDLPLSTVSTIKRRNGGLVSSRQHRGQAGMPGSVDRTHPGPGKAVHQPETTRRNPPADLPKIIGATPPMQRLRKNVERLAGLDCNVVIRGETGTGREMAARTIHYQSRRRNQRFLAFDCGCFSSDFRFFELFGSTETSALDDPAGNSGKMDSGMLFTGTVLLDHIENMPADAQKQMLTLASRRAEPGSPEAMVDLRFIIATHLDLKEPSGRGSFNQDLLTALNAIEILVPPLRERRDDIVPLCSYFLSLFNREFDKEIESISTEVFSVFKAYPFPGNVRELKHIIERAVIIADGSTIEARHLPDRLNTSQSVVGIHAEIAEDHDFPTLGQLENAHILKALEVTGGNRSKASEMLGISRAALWRKLKLLEP